MSTTPQLVCPKCGLPTGWRRCRRIRTSVTLKVFGQSVQQQTDGWEYECRDCKERVFDVDLTLVDRPM